MDIPQDCTLPAAERPLRVAEFDDLFRGALLRQQRVSATALCWELDPAVEVVARELAGRESDCCSFFSFEFRRGDGVLRLEVGVPDAHVAVLDGLEVRAAAGMRL